MKSNKINYLVVGTFVIAMVVGFVVAVAMLTGRTGAVDEYHAIYRNVTGVKFGTQVLYEGYPIGQVEEITPQPGEAGMEFRVDLSILQGWKIPEDSTAQIAASGLLAAVTVNIAAGGSQTPLEPGTMIPSKEAANMFAVMADVAGEMSELAEDSLKPLLKNLDGAVSSFSSLLDGEGGDLVREIRLLTLEIAQRVPVIAENVEQFTTELNQVGDEMQKVLNPTNTRKIQGVIDSMEGAARNVDLLTNDLNIALHKVEGLLETTEGLMSNNKDDIDKAVDDVRYVARSLASHVDSINKNLDITARNMSEFSRRISQNPGLLLGGTPPADKARR